MGDDTMTGYVLYGYATAGSAAVEAAMVSAGIAFEFRDVNPETGGLYDDAYRAVNPRQQVPTLVHPDGTVITELPAILNHLADAHPDSGLAPPPGSSARAHHDRWLAFLHANVYEGILRMYYSERYTDDPAGAEAIHTAAKAYVARHLALFGDAVGDGPYLGGDTPTGADFLVWVVSTWLDPVELKAASPVVAALMHAMSARPELADVVARNT
ncbi:glutathione S-transferase family protein [Rhodobacteraceae bacterium KMM 6894]|nr:glutathione S-transferase family protein [Rhodobacteraceae bacterium KMM 6894]